MILNTLEEPWQHNQSHVVSTEEDSKGFSSEWDDALGYRILSQLRQLMVFLGHGRYRSKSRRWTFVGAGYPFPGV